MGKSDKKIKSDRINGLRKQYDAFLEDDKKRKERNEYILEKLDKMRYCTAVVPVRQAPNYIDSRKVSLYKIPDQTLDIPATLSASELDKPRQRIDETDLLHEISKKYILIPKSRATYKEDDYAKTKPKYDDNTNWKSKYDILDKLKRDEKGQDDGPIHQETSSLERNPDLSSKLYFPETDITQNVSDDPLLEYKNELPVKLPPEHHVAYELQNYTRDNSLADENYHFDNTEVNAIGSINRDNVSDIIYSDNVQNNAYEENNTHSITHDDNGYQNMTYEQSNIDDIGHQQAHLNNNIAYDVIPSRDTTYTDQIPSNVTEESINKDQSAPAGERVQEYMELHNENVVPSNEFHTTSNEQNINDEPTIVSTELVSPEELFHKEEENNNILDVNNHALANPDMTSGISHEESPEYNTALHDTNVEYPIETVNVQDFTPHDGVQLVDGVNINPEPQLSVGNDLTHQYDPVVEPGNVIPPDETLNTDQNEDYYTEQKENYDYTQEGTTENDYTQEGITENYNTEYSAPAENYPQNEEYAYYEGAQPEQTFAEVNENEDVAQRYGQEYEQQYETTYEEQAYQQQEYGQEYSQGYNQQGYADPQQQYETVNQAQPDMPYETQDDNTPQYVEQQLDNEEGYVVNSTDDNTELGNVESHQVPAAVEQ